MTDEPGQPGQPGQPPPPDDENRRRFFRLFAGDVMSSVGTVLGAAQVLQRESAAAARDLLGDSAAIDFLGGPAVAAQPVAEQPLEVSALGVGYRTPLRWDEDSCRVVDQRRLPDILAELTIEGAADGVAAIRDGAVVGGAIQAQLAAVTLALTAARVKEHRPFARRATIRGAANALKNARSGSAAVRATVHRMLAVEERLGIEAPGEALDAAMHAEAEAVLREAVGRARHPGRAGDGGPAARDVGRGRPRPGPAAARADDREHGAMSGGQLGSALSAIMAVHHSGRPIHAIVAETRPGFEGSRIAAWELREAGVPHVVVTDAAAPGRIAAGEVDAVLVGADRVLADGDVIAVVGHVPAGAGGVGGRDPVHRLRRRRSPWTPSPTRRRWSSRSGRPAR